MASLAVAQDDRVLLQWFEQKWEHMERRVPDFFLAGYGGVWIPPPSRASDPSSAGYDVFDRFDLGSGASPTAYGTEQGLRAAIDELHAAGALVIVDAVLNHNSARRTDAGFQIEGGYPGFWMAPASPPVNKKPTDPWGDFHGGTAAGYYQSTNPAAPLYDLFQGDLVGLIDIAQESNHQFIRHPVSAGDPLNIPPGTLRNLPDPDNARLYPDLSLTPMTFWNPGTPRNPGATQFTIHPFNTADPMAGDPVPENATGLLLRWTRWMLESVGVDGFRLDAAKHVPSWFWDTYWDAAVHLRWRAPDGSLRTPMSFVESVESNAFTYGNYVRKDGFADRDALDLAGAGQVRDLLAASGFGTWQAVLDAHIDLTDDGFQNGSVGVNHVFSHDNGSAGDGSSMPPLPTLRQQWPAGHAYILLRPGLPLVYYNARGIVRSGGFFPREGVPLALGLDPATNAPDDLFTTLVRLRRWVGRGQMYVLNGTDPVNQSLDDVLIFERRSPAGGAYRGNALVGVNDRYSAGYQQRSVQTSFAPGTRLHELTGNAADPAVDPTGVIPEVLVVDGSSRVLIRVPDNASSAGEHNRGYVVYAPAPPAGSLTISPASGVIPADPPTAPAYFRRLNDVPVVTGDQVEVRLQTVPADPIDPNTDDDAFFTFGAGFADLNGNGGPDLPASDPVAPGFERFLTVHQPLYGSGTPQGLYVQNVDTTALPDGYHYVRVVARRHRDPGLDPIVREWRAVFYLDRSPPAMEIDDPGVITATSHTFSMRFLDRTGTRMHAMLDLPPTVDPIPLAAPANLALKGDRLEWSMGFTGLTHGFHSLTVVGFEASGNAGVLRREGIFVDLCYADANKDGVLDIFDYLTFTNLFNAGDPYADCDGSGVLDLFDFLCFGNAFLAGCG